ncbi:phage FluMu protein gp38 family protein [Acetobacteraceae bacterium AT-5844]|nr:phage FluMu protein gp38 family protein [Acetobacteraceae bacterium AT-5844]
MLSVKPAPGKSVRDPELRDLLPAGGRMVPRSAYWLRRLADGDVEPTTPAIVPQPEAEA